MAEKVTVMVLKVDLQCSCCYKKIKKLLCQFPQIRDQVYDEKQNQVVITVVCCSPEKIRDKLCCKGRKLIKSIDIKEPPKPKPPEPKPKQPEKPKEPEKPKTPEKPKEPEKPPAPPKPDPPKVPVQHGYPPPYPNWGCCGPCSEGYPGGPCYQGYGRLPPPPLLLPPPPPPPPPPCCGPCSEGYPGGPCYQDHGRSTPPPRPYYDGYGYGGGNRGCHVRCDYYFSEENPQACTIM